MSTQPKTFWQKFWKEIGTIVEVSLYFFLFQGLVMFLEALTLKDYNIQFGSISTAIINSLIIAKVVLLMEFIPISNWSRQQPTIVGIVLRTLLYTVGVLVIFLLEKAFESRHAEGGFGAAVQHVFQNRDIYQVWVNTIVIGISLLGYNTMSVVKQWLGERELTTLLFKTPLTEVQLRHNKNKAAGE
jgi:hypothetical protein